MFGLLCLLWLRTKSNFISLLARTSSMTMLTYLLLALLMQLVNNLDEFLLISVG
jgi:uncharacterized membrane protein